MNKQSFYLFFFFFYLYLRGRSCSNKLFLQKLFNHITEMENITSCHCNTERELAHTVCMDIHDLIQPEGRHPVLKCPSYSHGARRIARRSIHVAQVSGVAYGNKRGESKASRVVLEVSA